MKTLVLAVFLKMMDKTRENVSDSFSEGTFQLPLTRLGSIYMIELVACGIQTVMWSTTISRQTSNVILRGSPYMTAKLIMLQLTSCYT